MDIDEYKERSLAIGQGFHSLLDDMYAAIDEDAPLDEVTKLLERANHKIEQYEKLYSESSKVWREEMEYDHLKLIEEAHDFIKQLKEKYLESN
ncbi:hypothetical protein [Flavobacterium piscis]|uniref:DUF4298 domain-containing protein n=1 Tax=Flavobacterium piscis TaxID=1114874 RepID=A0ABU1YEV2_9FLAO|nr:hypothetical protein [Flavobacterium piscis]MDR7212081.1 hypothetical protein [Flavobacterium piscis]